MVSDTIDVALNVTDQNEKPLAPTIADVSATSGSTTSLDVSWTRPNNTGRPAITTYDLQYREGTSGTFISGPEDVATTSRAIGSLKSGTMYQVQVHATNAEGDGDWSQPEEGTTNSEPMFTEGDSTSRSFDETLGDETVATASNIGVAVTATDTDTGDTLTYTLEGTDAARFGIIGTSGQLQTKVGQKYSYEAKSSYSVTVRVVDGNGGFDTIVVTLNVTDQNEKPERPVAPSVSATSGSATSLDVSWTAPGLNGGPDITGYAVEYRKGTTGNFTAKTHSGTGTTTMITGLDAGTLYQVQVRALNGETPSDWSPTGQGTTDDQDPDNSAPTFTEGASTSRSFDETLGDETVTTASNIGAAVNATDPDTGDTLTYTLEGTDAARFGIIGTSGQLQTKVGQKYDYETQTSYSVTVRVEDGSGGFDMIDVTLNVTDQNEAPLAPTITDVSATSGSTTSLDVRWTAPTNTGRPVIISYDLQYREGTSGNFTNGPQDVSTTSAPIGSLMSGTMYQVQVRATNAEGDGDWSQSEEGTTGGSAPTGGDGSFTNVRVVEATTDYVELDWDTPPTEIAGVRMTRHRHGDPSNHVYVALDDFGTRLTGFRDLGVDPGQTYTYHVIPWVVNDLQSPVFSRSNSTLGDSVPVIAVTPPGPPFVAQAPTGLSLSIHQLSNVSATWNDAGRETPAYIFQWRRSDRTYGDGSENDPRTIINSREDSTYRLTRREGFTSTILGSANEIAYVRGLNEGSRYYFRVGTCQERLESDGVESCNLADVRFASERSVNIPSRP